MIENVEMVQKARLGPGYDSEATVLNRCVTYSDSGLTWEADPRHAELAVAELGLHTARPWTSPGDAQPNASLHHKELEPDGQKAQGVQSCFLEKTRDDLTRLKRIGRYLLYTPRAVWEFPLQEEESIVLIEGTLRC